MAKEKMKAIVWDGSVYPKGLSYEEVEIPSPPKGWVLVHNRAAGICGADLMALRGRQEIRCRTNCFLLYWAMRMPVTW